MKFNESNEKVDFSLYRDKIIGVDQMFTNIEQYTNMVINGINPSLVITGGPGLGKTFLVKKQLEEAGLVNHRHYVVIKGRTSPAGLYYCLYEHQDKIIVFDDCDSVFKDDTATNLLKAALDSYDERTISYISMKPLKGPDGDPLPNSFTFRGKVIFISNLDQSKIDPAIKSRSFVADLSLDPEQMLNRMNTKLDEVEPGVEINIKKDALKALKEAAEKFEGVSLNFRSLIKAIRIRKMDFPNWQVMVAEQCIESAPKRVNRGMAKAKGSFKFSGKANKAKINKAVKAGMSFKEIQEGFGISAAVRRTLMK